MLSGNDTWRTISTSNGQPNGLRCSDVCCGHTAGHDVCCICTSCQCNHCHPLSALPPRSAVPPSFVEERRVLCSHPLPRLLLSLKFCPPKQPTPPAAPIALPPTGGLALVTIQPATRFFRPPCWRRHRPPHEHVRARSGNIHDIVHTVRTAGNSSHCFETTSPKLHCRLQPNRLNCTAGCSPTAACRHDSATNCSTVLPSCTTSPSVNSTRPCEPGTTRAPFTSVPVPTSSTTVSQHSQQQVTVAPYHSWSAGQRGR